MHPAVARQLFEDEVGRWPPGLAETYGWVLHSTAYPNIDCEFRAPKRTPLRCVLECAQWDEAPPSIRLLDSSGAQLTQLRPNPTGVFNQGPHPRVGRSFVCMAGSAEYHTHDSHLNDRWDQYCGKPGFSLGDILVKLWNAWLKGSG